ncbi:MAG: two-component regulator propeller domain-containing protein [Gracilimonas sp.]|nr:two-component regulator propeller domain-containing protein [Gracilimonas sp.]
MWKIVAFAILMTGYSGSVFSFQDAVLGRSDSLTSKIWTIEDGLPVNTLNNMVQDSMGYLWISTYDGLVRFDGIDFKIYNHSNVPQMPHNRTSMVYLQEGVGLWVMMEYGGAVLKNKNGFHHFGTNEGFTTSEVTTLIDHSTEGLILGTKSGLYRYQDSSFSPYFISENEYQNQVNHIYEDADGSIYVSTNEGLVHIKEGEVIEIFTINENQKDNIFFVTKRLKDGTLLTGAINGLHIIDNGKLTTSNKYAELDEIATHRIFQDDKVLLYSTSKGLFKNEGNGLKKISSKLDNDFEIFTKMVKDSYGERWLVGMWGTLVRFDADSIALFNEIEVINEIKFNNIFEDTEHNLWLLSKRDGLIRINRSIIRTIGKREGLSGDNILGLLHDSKGNFWVGTRDDGLNKITGRSVTYYKENEDIQSDIVQSIAEDSSGNIWVGHFQKGLDKISREGITHIDIGENLEQNDVRAIYTASNGTIWVGTYEGIVKLDPRNIQHIHYKKEDGLSGNKVRYITEDADGSLWIGTLDGGVSHFENETFTNYTEEDGLSSNNIRSLHVDETDPGVLWIGTENNGLNRLKNGKIDHVSVQDGLPDYNIHWISEDSDQWIWISTNKGVVKLEKRDLNQYLDGKRKSLRFIHYGQREGMRNPEGNGSFQEAGLRLNRDIFWFATQEGVSIFNANKEIDVNVEPKVIIQEVVAGEQSYSTDSVKLGPNPELFRIDFHAITYKFPEKTRFRYRLVGRDKSWTETGFGRQAYLADVPPGEYEFKVQATNGRGNWVPQTASVFITVEPAYYQQVWFYMILAGLLGGLFYLFSTFRHQRLIRKQQNLERVIAEQTKRIRKEKEEVENQKKIIQEQANDLEEVVRTKDKFFSIIAHDLKNPFQILISYSEMLQEDLQNTDPEELKQGIQMIKDSSKSLYKLTENLLNWAKIQRGEVEPSKKEFLFEDVIEKEEEVFLQMAKQKNISLIFNIDSGMKLYADKDMVETILRNLFSNAIKFTPRGGQVTVHGESLPNWNVLKVTDTGIGMSDEMMEELLRLDESSSRLGTENERGSGLGLILCKEMMEMHGGKLEIASKVGKGSTFCIKFPKMSA